MTTYSVIKRYGHEQGFSCCFRQWRADSHCRMLHGYALSFELEFRSYSLDANKWVVDFGGLRPLKAYLTKMFDHTLVAAADDPELSKLELLASSGLADLRVLPAVGCEAFAEHVFGVASDESLVPLGAASLYRVRVSEHNGNHAEFRS